MIVVAGEALVDLVIRVDGSVSAELGGGPFNVARTIGRLGQHVAFLGAISFDRFGERLFAQLGADGVRTDLIVRTDAPTTLAAAEVDQSGAASYRFYISGTSAFAVGSFSSPVQRVDAVHVGTLGLVVEPLASAVEAYVQVVPDDAVVMVDPNCRAAVIDDRDGYLSRLQRVLSRAHIVKISTDDAEYLDPGRTATELAGEMIERGVRLAVVTAGDRETVVVTSNGRRSVPIPQVTVADTIGAGDAFGGGFLTAWLSAGLDVDDLSDLDHVAAAAGAANEVAGSTCTRVGAAPPWRDQLRSDWARR
jgi:fructokinase